MQIWLRIRGVSKNILRIKQDILSLFPIGLIWDLFGKYKFGKYFELRGISNYQGFELPRFHRYIYIYIHISISIHIDIYRYTKNTRNVCTPMHDALLFTTEKPNSEKYKKNILYKGGIA